MPREKTASPAEEAVEALLDKNLLDDDAMREDVIEALEPFIGKSVKVTDPAQAEEIKRLRAQVAQLEKAAKPKAPDVAGALTTLLTTRLTSAREHVAELEATLAKERAVITALELLIAETTT